MRRKDLFLILILWAVLTALNLTKAFHIDDTFHLEAAEWIRHHPTTPMSGLINWGDASTPMYTHNQPPLFFFMLSVIISFFGPAEIPLHLFLSVFTFLALYLFYLAARQLNVTNHRTLLVLFALCPAFVVNQNVMTDIPILAFLLLTVFFLLRARYEGKWFNYSMAAGAIGAGMLIKYSLLPVLALFPVILAVRRDYRFLATMLIPLTAIGLWSAWNYSEYGAIHLLGRPGGEIHINQFWSFLACTGAVGIFSIALLHGQLPLQPVRYFIYILTGLFFLAIILLVTRVIPEQPFGRYLNILFVFNGLLIFAIFIFQYFSKIRTIGFRAFFNSDLFVIGFIFFAISLFLVLFAPFMATRHILLLIPFALLMGHEVLAKAGKGIRWLTVSLTVVLGLLLGISDWKYADYYREMAARIELPVGQNTWTAGHWGWQWYTTQRGMIPYESGSSKVKEGDLLIFPKDVSIQGMDSSIRYVVIDKIWSEADLLTFFSGKDNASLYNSAVDRPPWRLSREPVDTIYVCRARKQQTIFLK
jgi:hypothetical protein